MVEVNPKYQPMVGIAAGATLLAGGAMFTPWESARIVGLTVLTGVTYGIVNDMFACRDCIEYFTVKHQYDPTNRDLRLLGSDLDPNKNAIVWGTVATWRVCALGGAVIALVARCPFPFLPAKITTAQLARYLAMGALLIGTIAHKASRAALEGRLPPSHEYLKVPHDLQNGWYACDIRNSVGYLGLAAGVLLLLPSIIIARALASY